jgi:hypothetical protein
VLVGQGGRDKEGRTEQSGQVKQDGSCRLGPTLKNTWKGEAGKDRWDSISVTGKVGWMTYAVRTAQAEKEGGTGQVGQDWLVTGKEGQIRRMEQVGEGRQDEHAEQGSWGMGERDGGAGGQSRWDREGKANLYGT